MSGTQRRKFLVVPLPFLSYLHVGLQLVVLVSAFLMVSVQYRQFLVCCSSSHGALCAKPFEKMGTHAPSALWSQHHCKKLGITHDPAGNTKMNNLMRRLLLAGVVGPGFRSLDPVLPSQLGILDGKKVRSNGKREVQASKQYEGKKNVKGRDDD